MNEYISGWLLVVMPMGLQRMFNEILNKENVIERQFKNWKIAYHIQLCILALAFQGMDEYVMSLNNLHFIVLVIS